VNTYGAWHQPDRRVAVDVLDRQPVQTEEAARA
jgi:hypothetical protein